MIMIRIYFLARIMSAIMGQEAVNYRSARSKNRAGACRREAKKF